MAYCVFCGSNKGSSPRYREAAEALGEHLARRGIKLVYGGGHIGLMGVVADAVLAAGGQAIGVIPEDLVRRELAHGGLSALHVVDSMHARKARMAELSDAFIALPGGAGTLEEMFEQWTWVQLGIHAKACAFLNVDGYFDPLRTMIGRMVTDGFLHPDYADMLIFEQDIDALFDRIACFRPPRLVWTELGQPPKP